MNYVKSCLIIAMLLGIGYSQDCDSNSTAGWNCDCNEDTWQDYYPEMAGCYLPGAYLVGADLALVNLYGVDFSDAQLPLANLSFANFDSHTDLSFANLEGACLEGAINFTQTDYLGEPILEGCADTWGNDCSFEDTDADGYDDMSYDAGYGEGFENATTEWYEVGYETGYIDGALSGDLNLDGDSDILDIVALVNIILNP